MLINEMPNSESPRIMSKELIRSISEPGLITGARERVELRLRVGLKVWTRQVCVGFPKPLLPIGASTPC